MSDLRHTEKGFQWSHCSTEQFHHFLNGDTATCLHNYPHEDESLARILPGKLLSLDQQCRKDRGTSACFKDERVCSQLFCYDSSSGFCVSYRPAAEGSECGSNMICLNGLCVYDEENYIHDDADIYGSDDLEIILPPKKPKKSSISKFKQNSIKKFAKTTTTPKPRTTTKRSTYRTTTRRTTTRRTTPRRNRWSSITRTTTTPRTTPRTTTTRRTTPRTTTTRKPTTTPRTTTTPKTWPRRFNTTPNSIHRTTRKRSGPKTVRRTTTSISTTYKTSSISTSNGPKNKK